MYTTVESKIIRVEVIVSFIIITMYEWMILQAYCEIGLQKVRFNDLSLFRTSKTKNIDLIESSLLYYRSNDIK